MKIEIKKEAFKHFNLSPISEEQFMQLLKLKLGQDYYASRKYWLCQQWNGEVCLFRAQPNPSHDKKDTENGYNWWDFSHEENILTLEKNPNWENAIVEIEVVKEIEDENI